MTWPDDAIYSIIAVTNNYHRNK